jgi:hypothetical protein
MAIEDLSPAEVSGGTEELRALLLGYAGALETIDGAPPVLWAGLERPRILRWLRFPAPRALVSTLLVRHVSRCISTLKRGGARRVALADDPPGPLRDLRMLELRGRYAMRRRGAPRRRARITRVSLCFVWVLALYVLIVLVISN